MDPELKFSQHLERQVNKANRQLGLIRRSFHYLDCDTMKLLFAALVRPHLEFGNCVWAPYLEKDKKLIENVLRRETKVVDGLKDLSYKDHGSQLRILKKEELSAGTRQKTIFTRHSLTHRLLGLYTNASLKLLSKGNHSYFNNLALKKIRTSFLH